MTGINWKRQFLSIYLALFRSLKNRFVPTKKLIQKKYRRKFGEQLNLDNPQTFNEKIQWKKLFDKEEIYHMCADKLLVRDYIKEKIGEQYLVPLLAHDREPSKIDFVALPTPYVIKPNNSSGLILLIYEKEDINIKLINRLCRLWLKLKYNFLGGELHYSNIVPQILVEKMLSDDSKEIAFDYKIHCFNGNIEFIQVDTGRYTNHKRSYFSAEWELLPFTLSPISKDGKPYPIDYHVEKPSKFEEMKTVATKLAKDFDYIRIDFYQNQEQIYIGELTFYHGSGFESFIPEKYNKIYGDKLKIRK